jgi:hypothetical protein
VVKIISLKTFQCVYLKPPQNHKFPKIVIKLLRLVNPGSDLIIAIMIVIEIGITHNMIIGGV